MKILVAVPAELGHDVRVIDYSPSFVEKLRRRLVGATRPTW